MGEGVGSSGKHFYVFFFFIFFCIVIQLSSDAVWVPGKCLWEVGNLIYLLSKAPGKKKASYTILQSSVQLLSLKSVPLPFFKKNIWDKTSKGDMQKLILPSLLFPTEVAISNSSISLRKLNLSVIESSYIILSVIEILSIVIAS